MSCASALCLVSCAEPDSRRSGWRRQSRDQWRAGPRARPLRGTVALVQVLLSAQWSTVVSIVLSVTVCETVLPGRRRKTDALTCLKPKTTHSGPLGVYGIGHRDKLAPRSHSQGGHALKAASTRRREDVTQHSPPTPAVSRHLCRDTSQISSPSMVTSRTTACLSSFHGSCVGYNPGASPN